MATTGADQPLINGVCGVTLAQVRRIEAVGFRSWPAASVRYDGTWALRLTAGHPAKRLNSVNPLDPSDDTNLRVRIERAERAFDTFGRPLIFRLSPLAPPRLDILLEDRGWKRFDETIVMRANLEDVDLSSAMDHVPYQDRGHWIDQCVSMNSFSASLKPGLSELMEAVHGDLALFLRETETGTPLAALMAVRFGDLCGLFEVITNPAERRQGHGRQLVSDALLWARERGARSAWLQVVANNLPAVGLYKKLGFHETYRYAYRAAGER